MFLVTLTTDQKEALFHLAHNVVVSDGELKPGEHEMMEEMRREMSLPQDLEAHYVDPEGMEALFDTRRSRIICVLSLLRLAYADGAFDIEEQGFLGILRRAFEISDVDYKLIDNWVRRYITMEVEISDLF